MNYITVIGNVGKDVETRYTKTGKAVVLFSVADNKKKPGTSGNNRDDWDAQWWRVVVWEDLAEAVAQEIHKGVRVEVTGRANIRNYTAKNGEEKTIVEITANRVSKAIKPTKGDNGFEAMGEPVTDETEIPF